MGHYQWQILSPCRQPPGEARHLDAIADQINDRPRKGLGVRSPLAVYRELLINSPQHSTEIH